MSYGEPPTRVVTKVLMMIVAMYLILLLLYIFSKMKYTIRQKFYQALFL